MASGGESTSAFNEEIQKLCKSFLEVEKECSVIVKIWIENARSLNKSHGLIVRLINMDFSVFTQEEIITNLNFLNRCLENLNELQNVENETLFSFFLNEKHTKFVASQFPKMKSAIEDMISELSALNHNKYKHKRSYKRCRVE
jgi:di/tripeptidase